MSSSQIRRGLCSGFASCKNFIVPACCAGGLLGAGVARADVNIGALRAMDPTLTGSGVNVAQVEAPLSTPPPAFEVNPSSGLVNQPVSLFTYYSTNAAGVTGFTNTAGTESSHADFVANRFYSTGGVGVAPGVARVDNYEANYFFNNVINTAAASPAQVINQSFIFTGTGGVPTQIASVDLAYDNYVARYNKVIVDGAGDGGGTGSPATAYNSIAVADSTGPSSVGPTADGRSKPDISATDGNGTSYAAPQVAGAAAVLIQAGARGDGGTGTAASATNSITIKALLLNGADKPAGWTHSASVPLDARYGAGNANVLNSYQQLKAGKFTPTVVTATTSLGGAHAPSSTQIGNVASTSGWDNNTITSGTTTDAVNNYYFNLTGSPTYTLTATLDWNKQLNATSINNLDLFLYNATTGALVDQSISGVDNVEHLFDQLLPAGRYDLEVLKHGGLAGATAGDVSNAETYALAFNYAATPEPSGAMLLLGAAGAGVMRRRRK